jgi:hypothetical protein
VRGRGLGAALALVAGLAGGCGGSGAEAAAPCDDVVDVYVAAIAGLDAAGRSRFVVVDTNIAPISAHEPVEVPVELLNDLRAAQATHPLPRCAQALERALDPLDGRALDAMFAASSAEEAWGHFEATYEAGGYWTLSAVGFDRRRSEALCLVGYLCGPRCGEGHLVHLRRTGHTWTVVSARRVWTS